MGNLSEFGINILTLENKQYEFEYEIGDGFFTHFENSELRKGVLKCQVVLEKTSSFIRVNFRIEGWVELVCDRSLDPFPYPVKTGGQMIFHFGTEDKEIDDESMMITRNRQQINLAQDIYEYISTAVPMKKLHPRYHPEEESDNELFYTTGQDEADKEKKSEIDPRWEALSKLKKNNH